MKPISINIARDLAFGVDEGDTECVECLFNGKVSCSGCQCAVGNVLKRLVDEGFLSIDESAEKEVME